MALSCCLFSSLTDDEGGIGDADRYWAEINSGHWDSLSATRKRGGKGRDKQYPYDDPSMSVQYGKVCN